MLTYNCDLLEVMPLLVQYDYLGILHGGESSHDEQIFEERLFDLVWKL